MNLQTVELSRQAVQSQLDAGKTQAERNQLGQFSTPQPLAADILSYASTLLKDQENIRFLDPAFGTGAFYSALLQVIPRHRISSAIGYEIDPNYGNAALDIWAESNLELIVDDFTRTSPQIPEHSKPNLIICNPPYVRHHHLSRETKERLANRVFEATELKLSGLAGLYCYFMLICHEWMSEGGVAGWLIPSEFMDVKYGEIIKHYLTNKVQLLRIHRFDPNTLQFEDALVSSAVVWFRKTPPSPSHMVQFTFGGTLGRPRVTRQLPISHLDQTHKWTQLTHKQNGDTSEKHVKLADLFEIKRGLATGANKFFIISLEKAQELKLPPSFIKPILPSPRYVPDEIFADEDGYPILPQQLFLIDCRLPPDQVKRQYETLWRYYLQGIDERIHQRYLCRNRSPWYSQEDREPVPILCTYMGRNNKRNIPFRFILNHSIALATNVYLLLSPKPIVQQALARNPELYKELWKLLISIPVEEIISEGRVYGGGLHKVEPNELASLPLRDSSTLKRMLRLGAKEYEDTFVAD